jgi:hypothetical protein
VTRLTVFALSPAPRLVPQVIMKLFMGLRRNTMLAPVTAFEKLTAAQILALDEKTPERLFPRDEAEVKRIYHGLAKIWYPDVNPDPLAADVFKRLAALHEAAKQKLTNNTWQEPGTFTCHLKSGKTFRVRSDAVRDFELGTLHVSPTTITYVVDRQYADLFQNAVQRIKALAFLDDKGKPSAKMKEVYAPCLPTVFKTYEAESAFILTIKKRPDDVRLRDLLPHLPKDTRDRHVAWITSRMLEMGRYLDHAGLTHNAMTLDTVFASPSGHTIGLFGGWWYAAPFGTPLTAVPGEATEFLPDTGSNPVYADGTPDREMIRAAARELLGDRGGTRFTMSKPAPQPMIDFLRLPSSGSAQNDLHDWYQDFLPRSFGPRRFTKLPVTYSDVYQPGS